MTQPVTPKILSIVPLISLHRLFLSFLKLAVCGKIKNINKCIKKYAFESLPFRLLEYV